MCYIYIYTWGFYQNECVSPKLWQLQALKQVVIPEVVIPLSCWFGDLLCNGDWRRWFLVDSKLESHTDVGTKMYGWYGCMFFLLWGLVKLWESFRDFSWILQIRGCENHIISTTKFDNISWNMGVSKNNGTPKSSQFNRVFHPLFSPSILGYHYFWKHPYTNQPCHEFPLPQTDRTQNQTVTVPLRCLTLSFREMQRRDCQRCECSSWKWVWTRFSWAVRWWFQISFRFFVSFNLFLDFFLTPNLGERIPNLGKKPPSSKVSSFLLGLLTRLKAESSFIFFLWTEDWLSFWWQGLYYRLRICKDITVHNIIDKS